MLDRLLERNSYAMGIAARHTGAWVDAFRPSGPDNPIDPVRRYMRLPAQFMAARGGERRANLPGDLLWHGVFDTLYTQPGDYLSGPQGTFFIASQVALGPALCVMTNRVVTLTRPGRQSAVSGNPYGGYSPDRVDIVIRDWPAAVVMNEHYGRQGASLPTDEPLAYLSLMLPSMDGRRLHPGDLVHDDIGRSAVLVATEETPTGWRLAAKMVTN
ncbi:MAG: hypothetical protein INR62_05635 [Rhodospirillales bacterium]|nr:hypothetical protein [Acetobacter sp.]